MRGRLDERWAPLRSQHGKRSSCSERSTSGETGNGVARPGRRRSTALRAGSSAAPCRSDNAEATLALSALEVHRDDVLLAVAFLKRTTGTSRSNRNRVDRPQGTLGRSPNSAGDGIGKAAGPSGTGSLAPGSSDSGLPLQEQPVSQAHAEHHVHGSRLEMVASASSKTTARSLAVRAPELGREPNAATPGNAPGRGGQGAPYRASLIPNLGSPPARPLGGMRLAVCHER